MPNNMNLHRNVFFKDCAKVPVQPFSALDSTHPVDLWAWMDGQRKAGNELLAISHNANLSDGRMFPTEVDSKGRPIDAAYAASRVRNEPLIEIKQLKGTSETHPLLSPNDEFANFELMSVLLGGSVGAHRAHRRELRAAGAEGRARDAGHARHQPVQVRVRRGVRLAQHRGSRIGRRTSSAAIRSPTVRPKSRMAGNLVGGFFDARTESTAGLTGVWAEENTRASLFEAMQRKETFAVSGPHIKVRLFGGWEYTAANLAGADWVKTGYAKGVPMGGDLPPAKGKAPTFIVWAVKDPTSGNLDRIQIVKGWSKSGQSFEKIFDVVWSGERKPNKWTGVVPPIGNTVDVETATYTNTIGAVELKTVWTDPEFDPGVHAFYYARVLEIPTPRWTTIQAKQLGIAPPDVVAATVQERAWSSPIWYTPGADDRKNAKAGMTVADLKKKGAVALTDAQLRSLILAKSNWLQNNVTGDKYMIIYGAPGKGAGAKPISPSDAGYNTQRFPVDQGQFQLKYVGRKMELPSLVGDASEGSQIGETRSYFIQNGKIVNALAGTPIEITVYKVGDKYVAARSNEFGYANYEIIPTQTEVSPLAPPRAASRVETTAARAAGSLPAAGRRAVRRLAVCAGWRQARSRLRSRSGSRSMS